MHLLRSAHQPLGWFLICLCSWLFSFSALAASPRITFNFKQADLATVAATVAEISGKNFIIDPRVKGKVTVVSSHAMDKDEAYEVFLSILQVHGFAAITSGDIIKIVPETKAKQTGSPIRKGKGDEFVTQVVKVNQVSAAQLVPILRPLIPQQGHLAAYATTNVLIISDRAQNINRIINLVRRIDKISEVDVMLVPLEHATASDVIKTINALFKASPDAKSAAASRLPVLIADDRTNSILVGGAKVARLRVMSLISKLDIPVESEGNTQVIYLRFAKASDMASVLKSVTGSLTSANKQNKSKKVDSKEIGIEADEQTNALVITAPSSILRSLRKVIEKLDVRRAQVKVEAIIAEVSKDLSREFGIQWAVINRGNSAIPAATSNFSNSGSGLLELGNALGSSGSSSLPIGDGLTLGVGKLAKNGVSVIGLVRALAGDGNTNILSMPSFVTLDNEEATIVVGQNVPFITGSFSSTGDSGGASATNPFQTIERQDVGLTLKVKPQINEGDTILMEISQEVSSLASSSTGASDIITNTRSIETNVLVNNGEVVILGGLIQDDLKETEQKIPLLGDIPVLGALFRYSKITKAKTNLMVFIHPVILRSKEEGDFSSEARFNQLRDLQKAARSEAGGLLPEEASPLLPRLEKYLGLETAEEPQASE